MPATAYPHIEITPEGVPILTGTTVKVVEVVMDRLAHHWDSDEIQRQRVSYVYGNLPKGSTLTCDQVEQVLARSEGKAA